ncbi:MAG: exodeoxyribonuclease VII small subunit [Bacteroidaceae bacterium]|nr:exodeoxyribonuclease VII small subunit [Bacteroidaceae bacterium]
MMQEKMTYEQALQRLETIANRLEQGDVPIDEIARQLKEAQQLVKLCRDQLTAADEAIAQLNKEQEK